MPGSGHRTQANRALVARLEQHDTGRLRVGRGLAALHVCVWDGDLVAATTPDDLRHLLRRLLLAGEVDAEQVRQILDRATAGEPVMAELIDNVQSDVMATILYDRFIENLTRYLGSGAKPRFSHLPAIYNDNFQLGHDIPTLLQTCADAWDDAMSVDLDMELYPGAAPPRTGLQRVVLSRVGNGVSVSRLLVQLPAEPFSARALVARMLRARILDTVVEAEADTQHTASRPVLDTDERHAIGPEAAGEAAESYIPDDATPISVSSVLEPSGQANVPVEVEEETDDPPTEEVSKEELLKEPASQGAGDLTSLDAWMNHGVELDGDMEAFVDHEDDRGGGEGGFTTEEHNLDRVEVVDVVAEEKLEMDAQPTARFGAPVLSDEETENKIRVANGVIMEICRAMNEAEGAGRGQAALQILLDGSPAQYQPLFAGLAAEEGGSLPEAALSRNLMKRPPTEHRRLLNQGLLNLIERALSLCMEELPDEAIDEVLENVAGYRQRLGL